MAAMTEVEAKKALQTEVMAVKQKWGDAIKLSKTKDGPTAPLPISLQRTIQAPEDASAYDVAEYKVKLWLDSLDVSGEPLVRVEIDPADLVPSLASKMEERVGAQWRSELKARGLGKGWLLEKMFSWCESKFVELLNLEPACLDMYMGDDAMIHYVLNYIIKRLLKYHDAKSRTFFFPRPAPLRMPWRRGFRQPPRNTGLGSINPHIRSLATESSKPKQPKTCQDNAFFLPVHT